MFSVNRNKYLLFISMIFIAVMVILFSSGCSATVAQGGAAIARQDGATDKEYETSPSSLMPDNQPPSVTTTVLADGSTFTEGAAVTSNGIANGAEDRGALKLIMNPTSYDWEFIPIAGQAVADASSASCAAVSSNTINVPGDASTIQAGIDLAGDGDVVLVAPGEYHETIELSGKSITLASWFCTTQDPSYIGQTIIDGDGNTVITVNSSVGPETKIIGFTIQNGNDGISALAKLHILHNRFTGNQDAVDYEGSGGVCRYNVFENNRDDAIDLDGRTEAIIEDNIVRNNGDDGIEIRLHQYSGPALNIVIRRNIISGSGEDGIQLIDYAAVSNRVFLIERNLIKDSAMVGLGLMDNGETIEDFRGASIPERIHLFNNTFIGNDHSLTGGDNLIALNNIFVGSTSMALKNVDGDSIAAYNLFWGNGKNYQNSHVNTDTTISQEPPHLDGNYWPMPGSPAIDAGTAFYTWNSEIVLDLQPGAYAGAAPDLGAYERSRLFLPLILKSVGSSATFAQDETVCLREVRAIDTNDFGLLNPAGLAFSFGADLFFVLEARSTTQANIATMTPYEETVAWDSVDVSMIDPINLAFDNLVNRLLLFDTASSELVEVKTGPDGLLDSSPEAITRFQVEQLGLREPRGMAIDPANGNLFILDSAALQIARIEPDAQGGFDGAAALEEDRVSWVDLTPAGLVDPRGLAFNPDNDHLYLLASVDQRLYELDKTGRVVAVLQLPHFEFVDPQGLVFALSGDATDDPSIINLYIADTGLSGRDKTGKELGRIMEMSLPLDGSSATTCWGN